MDHSIATAEMRLGYKMLVDPAVQEQRDALQTGDYEAATLSNSLRFLPRGGVALDIGANIGFYACAFGKHVGDSGAVYAFEPVPANFSRLGQNISLNELDTFVHPFNVALGNTAGSLLLHIEPEGSANNAVGDNMASEADRLFSAKLTESSPFWPTI